MNEDLKRRAAHAMAAVGYCDAGDALGDLVRECERLTARVAELEWLRDGFMSSSNQQAARIAELEQRAEPVAWTHDALWNNDALMELNAELGLSLHMLARIAETLTSPPAPSDAEIMDAAVKMFKRRSDLRATGAKLFFGAAPPAPSVPDGWKLVRTPPSPLDSNGIAVNRETGFVYVLHADGVNWTSAARLTELTHRMIRDYPPAAAPEPPK